MNYTNTHRYNLGGSPSGIHPPGHIPSLYATEKTPEDDKLVHVHYYVSDTKSTMEWFVVEASAMYKGEQGQPVYIPLSDVMTPIIAAPAALSVVGLTGLTRIEEIVFFGWVFGPHPELGYFNMSQFTAFNRQQSMDFVETRVPGPRVELDEGWMPTALGKIKAGLMKEISHGR